MLKLSDLQLDRLIKEDKSFILYREPSEEQVYFMEVEQLQRVSSIRDIKGDGAFVFAPFEQSEEQPILLLKGNPLRVDFRCILTGSTTEKHYTKLSKESENASVIIREMSQDMPLIAGGLEWASGSKEDYTQRFLTFKQALEEERFKKLVLARSKELMLADDFDPKACFRQIVEQYPTAYCYLLYTPITGLWLGASPECLLTKQGNACSTVALAGTQILEEGQGVAQWSDSLQEEQAYVLDFIEERMTGLGLKVQKSKSYSSFAGGLAHLKTDISFELSDALGIGTILESLHPTPALCGLPKEEAKAFILANEGFDRGYYGGFFGFVDNELAKLYVNIRCMQQLSARSLRLYAGGGLLKGSILEDEWQETEAKMRTMQQSL